MSFSYFRTRKIRIFGEIAKNKGSRLTATLDVSIKKYLD